ncbi:MAG: hypothetical protein WBE76_06765 [Terracidiphilus sp.]
MNAIKNLLWKCVSFVSVCTLMMPSPALAKPLNADSARARIAKRGVGAWACVEERNGILLIGRIVSVDTDSFGMQLENYPDITPVAYTDVTRLRFGLSGKGIGIMVGASVALAVISAVVMHHEFEANKPQLPTAPIMPPFP